MFTIDIYDKNTSKEILLNRNGIVTISNLLKCTIKQRINAEYNLEVECRLDDVKAKYLKCWNIIKADGQLFRIYNVKEDTINNTITVNARHIFYDLDDGFMIDNRAEKKTVKEALQIAIKTDGFEKIFEVDSDVNELNTLYMVEQSPLTSIFQIIERWGNNIELERDNFKIAINQPKSKSSGIEIIYRKNLLSFDKETDTDRICSRIYPKGKNGIVLPEKFVSVKGISVGESGLYRERTKLVQLDEAEDIVNLRILANRYVENLHKPFENLKVDFLDITTLDKFKKIEGLKQVKVNDIVDVKNDLYDTTYQFKCVYLERDLLRAENTKAELGELKEYLDKVDFGVVYNAIEASKPSLFFYQNDKDLTINNNDYTQLMREPISVISNTHLKLYIAINGLCDVEDTTLEIQILGNNEPISFQPFHKLNIGNNVIGIPLAIPQVQGGDVYTISIKVKTDNNTFFITQNNAQIFVEGTGLAGGLSSDMPYIDISEKLDIEDINVKALDTKDSANIRFIDPIRRNPSNSQLLENIKINNINASDNVLIELKEYIGGN